jgi:hypothetical protein
MGIDILRPSDIVTRGYLFRYTAFATRIRNWLGVNALQDMVLSLFLTAQKALSPAGSVVYDPGRFNDMNHIQTVFREPRLGKKRSLLGTTDSLPKCSPSGRICHLSPIIRADMVVSDCIKD